jgi:hypothetical protein
MLSSEGLIMSEGTVDPGTEAPDEDVTVTAPEETPDVEPTDAETDDVDTAPES